MKVIKILVIVLLLLSITGCTEKESYIGRYEYTDNPSDYIVLLDNEHFLVNENNNMYTGDYFIHENYVILTNVWGSNKLLIKGSSLIDNDGWIWKKT